MRILSNMMNLNIHVIVKYNLTRREFSLRNIHDFISNNNSFNDVYVLHRNLRKGEPNNHYDYLVKIDSLSETNPNLQNNQDLNPKNNEKIDPLTETNPNLQNNQDLNPENNVKIDPLTVTNPNLQNNQDLNPEKREKIDPLTETNPNLQNNQDLNPEKKEKIDEKNIHRVNKKIFRIIKWIKTIVKIKKIPQ